MPDNTTEKIFVSAISWERVFLRLDIVSKLGADLRFKLRLFRRAKKTVAAFGPEGADRPIESLQELPIRPDSHENGVYHFVLNITCLDGRNFLDNGSWQILALTEGMDAGEAYICSVSHELAYELEDRARIFRYGGKYAYNISFRSCSDDRQLLSFVIDSCFVTENKRWNRRCYLREALTPRGKRRGAAKDAAIRMMRAFYWATERLSPKKGNRILFMTETKEYLWGNLKAIHDRMTERGMDQRFQISCSTRNAVGRRGGVLSWLKLVSTIARQDYIFVDDYVPIFGFLNLSSRTKLIQVWHAGEGFKAVGYCRFGKEGTPFPVGTCHKKFDYVITGSERLVHVFEEVFGIPRESFLPLGMARLDGFLDVEKIEGFREKFYRDNPQFREKKLILFAPTYRGTDQKTAYYDYGQLDLGEIYEFCGASYIWAFKMHPFVRQLPEIPNEYRDRIVVFDSDADINELYYVTDLLITDYSSNYFEYALMKKPVLFFTYDREIYELTRGVHRSIRDTAPGKVCDTFEEMMEALRTQDLEEEKILAFAEENFKNYDGKACDRIIDRIILGQDTRI